MNEISIFLSKIDRGKFFVILFRLIVQRTKQFTKLKNLNFNRNIFKIVLLCIYIYDYYYYYYYYYYYFDTSMFIGYHNDKPESNAIKYSGSRK